ncbi:MAG: Do family serine endopeptidase [Pseudolabrys sp.]
MTPSDNAPASRGAKIRRFFLATTAIAGIGAALAFAPDVSFKPQAGYPAAVAQNLTAQAKKVQAPVGFADIVEQVKPAVIAVRVKVNNVQQSRFDSDDLPPGLQEFFKRFGMPNTPNMPQRRGPGRVSGQGSGFFISADGYAVTNNHVVANAESVEVQTDDGKMHTAKVIGTDSRTDLALIKVEGGSFPYVKLAEKTPRIGDWVLAVGNPFGLGGTVTAGIVSARGRDIGAGPYDDFIQIDAPVNKGNSGGPTFDTEGNVIGVNTAIFSPSGGNVGIAFAIPAATVQTVVQQLKDHGSVTRGWIGVQIQPVTKELAEGLGLKKTEGALVAEPQDNSPAVKAGIKAGDVITAVNGEAVKDARDLVKKIGGMAPNSTVKLSIMRDGSEKMVSVTLGELPGPKEMRAAAAGGDDDGIDVGKLGLTLAPASRVAGSGSEGVAVTAVDPSGDAAGRGFATGDVILEVSGKAVSTPADVRNEIAAARKDGKNAVLMRVKKGERSRFVALPIKRG